MFASLRRQSKAHILAKAIRDIRASSQPSKFGIFKTSSPKTRLEPPKSTRGTPAVPKQKPSVPTRTFLKTMGRQPETGAKSRPARTIEADPLENKPILERRKLQALISLYHQSRNFITREELDNHIDSEFGYAERLTETRLHSYSCEGLKSNLHERKSTPTYTTNPPLFTFDIDPNAGATRSRGLHIDRHQRLAGVMYGTDERGEPALEAVEEAIERGWTSGGISGRKGI